MRASNVPMNKPEIKIYDAEIRNEQLYGFVKHHPKLGDDLDIVSSQILSVEDNVIETRNTVYLVQSWLKRMPQDGGM